MTRASAADAGVNHGDVNGSSGEESMAGRQSKRAGTNVACRNFVGDVHQVSSRLKAQDDALHRSNEPIGRAEVGR